jgi:peptidoglycan hydrolase-like protein with peptidoglycan-binding domain
MKFLVLNREGQELSTRDMQKVVQALPQYRDQLDKLSLHIHVSSLPQAHYCSISITGIYGPTLRSVVKEVLFGMHVLCRLQHC